MIDYDEIARDRGESYARELKAIIEENIKRGRLKWYLEQNESHTEAGYAAKVMRQYDDQHVYIQALQRHRDVPAWLDVQEKTQGMAYRLLRRWGFTTGQSLTVSDDVSQDACLQILFAHYPYDSNLTAWMSTVVLNVCRKYARGMRADEKRHTDLEKAEYEPHEESSQARDLGLELKATQDELNEAILQLPPLQQEFILAYYFLGKSLPEIAEELGVSPNTIYKRHHDALKNLGKILGRNGH